MRKLKRFPLLTTLVLAGAAQASMPLADPLTPWTDEYDQRQQAWDVAALSALVSVSPDALPPAEEGVRTLDVVSPALAPDVSAVAALMKASALPGQYGEPLELNGCWYVAGSSGWYRPDVGLRWKLLVQRLPSTGCVEEVRELDSSYSNGPPQMIATERQGLALAFPSQQSPSGPSHLRLYQVDPDTLDVVRQAFLGSSASMNTRATAMTLEGNRLIVHGTKTGSIPGEVGSGDAFIATFPRFFSSEDAPSVFAHPGESLVISKPLPGVEELLTDEELKRLDEEGRAREAAALEETRAALASAGPERPTRAAVPSEPEPAVVDDGLTALDALRYLHANAPEKLSALADGPLYVRGCWYVFTREPFGWPPFRIRYSLTRVPSQNCQGTTTVLDTVYSTWGHSLLAREGQGIAIAFQVKWTLSGSGLAHTRVVAVDPRTMAVKRSFVLGTYMGSTYLQGIRFEENDLIVNTSRYTATFPRFLISEVPPLGVIFP